MSKHDHSQKDPPSQEHSTCYPESYSKRFADLRELLQFGEDYSSYIPYFAAILNEENVQWMFQSAKMMELICERVKSHYICMHQLHQHLYTPEQLDADLLSIKNKLKKISRKRNTRCFFFTMMKPAYEIKKGRSMHKAIRARIIKTGMPNMFIHEMMGTLQDEKSRIEVDVSIRGQERIIFECSHKVMLQKETKLKNGMNILFGIYMLNFNYTAENKRYIINVINFLEPKKESYRMILMPEDQTEIDIGTASTCRVSLLSQHPALKPVQAVIQYKVGVGSDKDAGFWFNPHFTPDELKNSKAIPTDGCYLKVQVENSKQAYSLNGPGQRFALENHVIVSVNPIQSIS